jgi:hypothetical protein
MSCLATLVINAQEKMAASYSVIVKSIEEAMLQGRGELILNATLDYQLVSEESMHMLTANALVDNGFKVTRGGNNTFIVSGWDKVKVH